MTKEKTPFFSFDGEMGRIDYWGSAIFRSLIAGLIFFVVLALIFRGYFSSSYEELSTAITQWTSDHAVRVWLLGEILNIFLFLPITWRRWRDLGPRLKKNWLYISVLSSLMPGYEVFPFVGMQSLIITLGILSIYPNFKLLFWPGKRYASLRQSG
ncbi:DUF805 domain-containing protein [Synechococcus sp. UW179A]|uniref:DUF805 domain-containing protein n=1 Tax=Synechococcus sp. UW179A TaxID=2575510 RepID=UPI000E0E8DED|nr:DUF805 domain-containing protein [Synechococcus sp. UW179A]